MGKKGLSTPRSRVRAALRQVWLRSRERAAALKREHNCCESCGVKASKRVGHEVHLEVHHLGEGIRWEEIIDAVYRELLVDPMFLEVLCKDCHREKHDFD